MITQLKKLFVLGVLPEQNFHQKRDIIFVNQACFVLILCALIVFLCNIFFGFHIRALVPIGTMIFFFTALYSQYRQWYKSAKCLALIGSILSGVLSTIIFGAEAKTQYYLFASFGLGLSFFNHRSQHLIVFLAHFLLFGVTQFYVENYAPIISGQDSIYLSYFHIPVIFTCIFVTLSEFILHFQRFEERTKELMDSITEHSELLEIEKSKFEVQTHILQNTNEQLLIEIDRKEAAEQKLLESNAELEQFAYVASHDLKEPLRTIGSFTQLLKKKLDPHFDKAAEEYYYFVVDGVKRMSNLLDDLLSLSKLNKQIEITKVDIQECVDQNCLNLNNAIEQSNAQIISQNLPVINASAMQLNQLFQNLISNALKFQKKDTIPEIKINCEEQEEYFLFSIEDNGIGIKQEFLDKVFIIFQRLDKKTQYEGTGIGLTICKKVVQNHLGRIWIESVYGEGTTFYFTLSKNLTLTQAVEENKSTEKVLLTDFAETNV